MVQPLLESITDMLIMEVQKTFDFFRETYPDETITQVLISGGTSQHDWPCEKDPRNVLRYPTEVLDPFKTHLDRTEGERIQSDIPRPGTSRGRRFGFEGV